MASWNKVVLAAAAAAWCAAAVSGFVVEGTKYRSSLLATRRRPTLHPRLWRRSRLVPQAAISPAALAVATGAVARLVTLCGLGMAYARLGVLTGPTCATLSRLIYFVFQPSMLFVNCMTTISSAADPWRLGILPAFALAQIGLGLIFGSIALRVAAPRAAGSVEARELRALCAFGNAGPLPFVFAEGFFRSHPDQLARAVAYISFYLVGWSPLFWTLGPLILDSAKRQFSIRRIASPPVLASVLGVLFGSQPALATLLSNGPVRPLFDSLKLLGQAYLPTVALVLAGTLARSLDTSNSAHRTTAKTAIPLAKRLALLTICRFIWLPLASFGLLARAEASNLLPGDDPLMRFVLLMASAMPSAQNAIVILQLAPDAEFAANSMAKTIAILYLVAVLPMALLLSSSLDFTGLIRA